MSENGMLMIQLPTRSTNPEELAAIRQAAIDFVYPPQQPEMEIELEEPQEQAPTAPRLPPVRLPYPPARSRAWSWLILQVGTAYRFKRLLSWSLRLPPRAWSFVRVVSSKAESVYEKEERDRICSECPHRQYRMKRTRKGVVMHEHCGNCGCPDWYYSRNEVRNGYSAWECPMRLHPGPYRDDDLREALKENGYDPATVFAGGGCTGCGCGKAK